MAAEIGNKYAAGNEGGQPTKYKPEFVDQVYKLCLLGATDEEIADFFGVATSTYYLWRTEYIEFSEAVRRGKLVADAEVANSLFKRANGYEYEETVFEKIDGKVTLEATSSGEIKSNESYKKKVVVKQLPPDVGAISQWLTNRQRNKWKNRQDVGVDFDRMNDEDLQKVIDGLTNKILKNE